MSWLVKGKSPASGKVTCLPSGPINRLGHGQTATSIAAALQLLSRNQQCDDRDSLHPLRAQNIRKPSARDIYSSVPFQEVDLDAVGFVTILQLLDPLARPPNPLWEPPMVWVNGFDAGAGPSPTKMKFPSEWRWTKGARP